MRKYPTELVLEIIRRLENQERNIDIAKECGASLSMVEKINGCKIYTELHNYKTNIRKENKPDSEYRKNVLNEYIEHQDYYELHIINTHNVEVYSKIDKDDYERVSQYKWSLSVHGEDIRVVSNDSNFNRIGLHQFVLNNKEKDLVIDHINRNPLDNRKSNLRIVNRAINSTNAKPRKANTSGIRGVYKRAARPGISKECWVCDWTDENHKRHSKSFSIDKYGEEEAFRLASTLRQEKMEEMKI